MSNKINEFIRALGGGIRGNRFQVILNLPGGVRGDTRTLDLMCRATSIPSMETGIIEIPYFGKQRKISGDERAAGEWSITAFLNNKGDLATAKKIADQWQKLAAESSNIDEYITDGQIAVLDPRTDAPILSYDIKGVWVSTSGELALSQDSVDEILEFELSLQYDDVIAR